MKKLTDSELAQILYPEEIDPVLERIESPFGYLVWVIPAEAYDQPDSVGDDT